VYGMKKARVLRVEARRRPVASTVTERSPWDRYAESCSCGLPPGECRAHPRAWMSQRPPRRRLAGLGVRAGVRLAVRRPVAAAPGFGRARDPRTAAGKRQPLLGLVPLVE